MSRVNGRMSGRRSAPEVMARTRTPQRSSTPPPSTETMISSRARRTVIKSRKGMEAEQGGEYKNPARDAMMPSSPVSALRRIRTTPETETESEPSEPPTPIRRRPVGRSMQGDKDAGEDDEREEQGHHHDDEDDDEDDELRRPRSGLGRRRIGRLRVVPDSDVSGGESALEDFTEPDSSLSSLHSMDEDSDEEEPRVITPARPAPRRTPRISAQAAASTSALATSATPAPTTAAQKTAQTPRRSARQASPVPVTSARPVEALAAVPSRSRASAPSRVAPTPSAVTPTPSVSTSATPHESLPLSTRSTRRRAAGSPPPSKSVLGKRAREQSSDLSDVPDSPEKPRRARAVAKAIAEERRVASGSKTTPASPGKSTRPAWQRKIFLTSGLYSNDYKSHAKVPKGRHSMPANLSVGRSPSGRTTGTARTRDRNKQSAFPEPVHYGQTLLTADRDFRLPFPFLEEEERMRAKLATKRKPPPYKTISQNRYVSRPKFSSEIPVCQCMPGGTCGEDCLNRILQYVCDPKHCPCGDKCTNVSLRKRPHIKTEVGWYGPRGWGLKTAEAIKRDSFIDEYRGEVIDLNEVSRRVASIYKDTGNFYFLDYDAAAGEVLDGGLCGNVTRFANHSCEPNCYIEKWLVRGNDEDLNAEFEIGLYALRDIQAGEELTYDYGWSAFAPKGVPAQSTTGGGVGGLAGGISTNPSTSTVVAKPIQCLCGASNCCGYLGGKKGDGKKQAALAVASKPRDGKAPKSSAKAPKGSKAKQKKPRPKPKPPKTYPPPIRSTAPAAVAAPVPAAAKKPTAAPAKATADRAKPAKKPGTSTPAENVPATSPSKAASKAKPAKAVSKKQPAEAKTKTKPVKAATAAKAKTTPIAKQQTTPAAKQQSILAATQPSIPAASSTRVAHHSGPEPIDLIADTDEEMDEVDEVGSSISSVLSAAPSPFKSSSATASSSRTDTTPPTSVSSLRRPAKEPATRTTPQAATPGGDGVRRSGRASRPSTLIDLPRSLVESGFLSRDRSASASAEDSSDDEDDTAQDSTEVPTSGTPRGQSSVPSPAKGSAAVKTPDAESKAASANKPKVSAKKAAGKQYPPPPVLTQPKKRGRKPSGHRKVSRAALVGIDLTQHKPGTVFYTIAGQPFDFAKLGRTKGRRPRLYTWEEYNDKLAERRDRNAFLARIRRAKSRTSGREISVDTDDLNSRAASDDDERTGEAGWDESEIWAVQMDVDEEEAEGAAELGSGQAAAEPASSQVAAEPAPGQEHGPEDHGDSTDDDEDEEEEEVERSFIFSRSKSRSVASPSPSAGNVTSKKRLSSEAITPEGSSNRLIPALPSVLTAEGMSKSDARRARNAFLARVRRNMARGYDKVSAIRMASKPLPTDRPDDPLVKAQNIARDRQEQERKAKLALGARMRRAKKKEEQKRRRREHLQAFIQNGDGDIVPADRGTSVSTDRHAISESAEPTTPAKQEGAEQAAPEQEWVDPEDETPEQREAREEEEARLGLKPGESRNRSLESLRRLNPNNRDEGLRTASGAMAPVAFYSSFVYQLPSPTSLSNALTTAPTKTPPPRAVPRLSQPAPTTSPAATAKPPSKSAAVDARPAKRPCVSVPTSNSATTTATTSASRAPVAASPPAVNGLRTPAPYTAGLDMRSRFMAARRAAMNGRGASDVAPKQGQTI